MKWIFLLCIVNLLPAQKTVKKSIINSDIEFISLDVTNSFEVSINTVIGNEMLIEANIDGEYSKDVLVNATQSGNTLLVGTGFVPSFKNPNDKLSAHKVISIALRVSLPALKTVIVFGTVCNVSAKGNYKTLTISLSDGRCAIENINGVVEVVTQSGNISVLASSGKIQAASKYGSIGTNHIPLGDTFYNVSSITGDIVLNKM